MVAARAGVDEGGPRVEQAGGGETFDGPVFRSVGSGADVHGDGEIELTSEGDVDLGRFERGQLRAAGCQRHRHECSVIGEDVTDATDVGGEGGVALADPAAGLVLWPAVGEHGTDAALAECLDAGVAVFG